ncbi:MAG: ribosomal subunit interface protein [Elusimicrobia bacterium RIFOXYB2_FULL_62_6]|nr:MAG: ribosomal subunit interface protein [Elusimicrobia bacterium RIFOXYB2_FULL_62_6]
MRIHLVARKIKLTQPIKEFVEVKLAKLQEYVDNIVWAQVIINVEKKIHAAEVIVHAGHQTMKAAAESDDLYSAIDKAMVKMESQVKKYKEKFSEHRHQTVDMTEFIAYGAPQVTFSVIKDVPLHPLTKEEAVREMEKLGFNFWLFMDKNSRQMQVVFKRLDSTYGLLQPVRK